MIILSGSMASRARYASQPVACSLILLLGAMILLYHANIHDGNSNNFSYIEVWSVQTLDKNNSMFAGSTTQGTPPWLYAQRFRVS